VYHETKRPVCRYMAGILVPTLVLPMLLTVFIVTRIGMQLSIPIEQVMIFPMAVVPSLLVCEHRLSGVATRFTHPIGLHGAVLPLLMAPLGALVATSLNVLQFRSNGMLWFQALSIPYALVIPLSGGDGGILPGVEDLVGFLNRVLGIAEAAPALNGGREKVSESGSIRMGGHGGLNLQRQG